MKKLKDINPDEIKFTIMSIDDFEISLDRLTRFKFSEKKYPRVFSEIITKHLIEPKLSRQDIFSLEPKTIARIVENIWNNSLKNYVKSLSNDDRIKKLIIEEELSAFLVSDDLKELVSSKINFSDTLALLRRYKKLPLNIKRLILLQSHPDEEIKYLREKYALKFPVEKVVLCEGITEEILLPKFSQIYGYDFNKYGVHLISAGGKNQVAKLYCELKGELKIPVFILLDADAKPVSDIIKNILRPEDEIYLIKHGEFEDLFSLTLIRRTINNNFKNILKSSVSDFRRDLPMTKILTEYYRENQLGDYQKADFAKQIYENINNEKDLTEEIISIIESIKSV